MIIESCKTWCCQARFPEHSPKLFAVVLVVANSPSRRHLKIASLRKFQAASDSCAWSCHAAGDVCVGRRWLVVCESIGHLEQFPDSNARNAHSPCEFQKATGGHTICCS